MAVIRKLGANGDWIFHAIAAGLFAVDSFFLLRLVAFFYWV